MVVALATSMFWFPAPSTPQPRIAEFLEAERQYLLGPWPPDKLIFAALVPLFFAVVGLAFWRRSIVLGLTAINTASVIKIMWGFIYGGASGWSVVVPALVGLAIINATAVFALRCMR